MMTKHNLLRHLMVFFIFITLATVFPHSGRAKKHQPPSRRKNRSKTPTVSYKGFVVMEPLTGVILSANHPDIKVEPASVSKLMLAAVTLDFIKEGKAKLQEVVTVSRKASKMGGSQVYLKEGESFSLDELLYAIIVQSANDACVAVAEHLAGTTDAFVELMNKKVKQLHMKNTHYVSVSGLYVKPTIHDITTPRDMAILARYLLIRHPEILKYSATKVRGFRNNTFTLRSHNHLLLRYHGMDGLKTGYYHRAGFNLVATAKRGNQRFIVSLFGASTSKLRDKKITELMEHAFRNYRRVRLSEKGKPLETVALKIGKKKVSLPLNAAKTIDVVIEIGRKIQKTVKYLKKSPPFKKNEQVAEAIFYIGKKQIGATFLLSGKNVKKPGWSIFSIFKKS
jgi:D-alanyl-D-alanine carboxypeptidase (penicillin-binding protein 5/6)